MQRSEYPAAILQFRAAVAAAPTEPPIRVALIEALLAANHVDAAREEVKRGLERGDDDAGLWLAAGRVHRRGARWREATRALKRALRLDGDNEAAYLLLADTWRRRGRPRNVERTYRALLAAVPGSTEGNFELALQLIARAAYAEAEPLLRRVIADKPEHLRAWVALAQTQRGRGRPGSARKTIQRAFDRSHGDAAVADELFRRLLDTTDRKFAVAMLRAIDRSDLNADTRVSLGYLFLHAGEPRLALRLASSILLQSSRGEARILKATALSDLQRQSEALAVLLGVPATATSYAEARADAAEVLARMGQLTRALAIVRAALVAHPKEPALIASHTLALELGGDLKAARQVYADALLQLPANASLRLSYATMEERLGQSERAVGLVEPILETNPNETRALNFIGYNLANRGIQLARAERLLRRAVRLAPLDGYILDSWAWLQFRRGHAGTALRLLARAARLAPAEPEILWHLAEVHLRRNDRARALKLLTRALRFNPRGRVKQRIEARIRTLGGK